MHKEMGSSDVVLDEFVDTICILRRPRILLKNQIGENFIYSNRHRGIHLVSQELIKVM